MGKAVGVRMITQGRVLSAAACRCAGPPQLAGTNAMEWPRGGCSQGRAASSRRPGPPLLDSPALSFAPMCCSPSCPCCSLGAPAMQPSRPQPSLVRCPLSLGRAVGRELRGDKWRQWRRAVGHSGQRFHTSMHACRPATCCFCSMAHARVLPNLTDSIIAGTTWRSARRRPSWCMPVGGWDCWQVGS